MSPFGHKRDLRSYFIANMCCIVCYSCRTSFWWKSIFWNSFMIFLDDYKDFENVRKVSVTFKSHICLFRPNGVRLGPQSIKAHVSYLKKFTPGLIEQWSRRLFIVESLLHSGLTGRACLVPSGVGDFIRHCWLLQTRATLCHWTRRHWTRRCLAGFT